MKSKTNLVLLVAAIAACAAAIHWRRPASAPAAVTVSESAGIDVSVSTAGPKPPGDEPVQSSQPVLVSPPVASLTTEEIVAQLTSRIREGFASTNVDVREYALTNLLSALVLQDAAAEGRLAETVADTDLREAALRQVARQWAAKDSAGALAWAAALADPAERDATLSDVCQQVAETDPAAAVRMREPFVPDSVPNVALEGMMQQWAEKDLSAALAWTLARPQNGQREELIARLAFVEAQSNPAEAARLAVEQITPGPPQDEAVMSVLHQWALLDFAATSGWVGQFPEGPLRDRAVKELAGIAGYLHQLSAP